MANEKKKAGIFTNRPPNTRLNHLDEQKQQVGQLEAQVEAPSEAPQDVELNASKFNIPRKDVMPRDRLPSCRFKIYRGLLRIRMTTCLS